MVKKLAAAAAAGLVGGALALAGTAHAHHNVPDLSAGEPGECGEVTIFSAWQEESSHPPLDNARLIVEADGEVKVAHVGESVTVGPFDSETVTVRYRIFGGGERDYDVPLWNGHASGGEDGDAWKAEINTYGAEHGWDWTVAGSDDPNPFVTWRELEVEGCPPADDPTGDPTGDPTEKPDATKEEELAATGLALPLLIGAGMLLLVGGGLSMALARRRGLA
jgi:hypothetical protein